MLNAIALLDHVIFSPTHLSRVGMPCIASYLATHGHSVVSVVVLVNRFYSGFWQTDGSIPVSGLDAAKWPIS